MKWNKEMYLMAGLSGISVVAAVASYIQHRKTAALMERSIAEVAKATPVEIEKDLVDRVVQEALEMKVDTQVDEILEETKKDIRKEVDNRCNLAVRAELELVRDKVGSVFTDKLSQISEDDVKRLVVDKSASLINKKLEGQFDDICRGYNQRLDEFNRIYAKMLSNAPNLSAVANVNPGIHVSW